MTTRRHYSNTAAAQTTAGTINGAATSVVTTGSFATWSTQFPFHATLDIENGSREVVLVTAIVGTTATITRGQDGTSAVSHPAGASFNQTVGAQDFDEASAHTSSTSGVHGITGNVVGDTDTQTLSNKTILGAGLRMQARFADGQAITSGSGGGPFNTTLGSVASPAVAEYDTLGPALVTTTGAITIPASGTYVVDGVVLVASSTSANLSVVMLRKNGADLLSFVPGFILGSASGGLPSSFFLPPREITLTAADVLTVVVRTSASAGPPVYTLVSSSAFPGDSFFRIERKS